MSTKIEYCEDSFFDHVKDDVEHLPFKKDRVRVGYYFNVKYREGMDIKEKHFYAHFLFAYDTIRMTAPGLLRRIVKEGAGNMVKRAIERDEIEGVSEIKQIDTIGYFKFDDGGNGIAKRDGDKFIINPMFAHSKELGGPSGKQ